MPRYFFNVQDGADYISDDEGTALTGIDAAVEEASLILVELARVRLARVAQHDVLVSVSTGSGPIMTAALSFSLRRAHVPSSKVGRLVP